MAFRVPGPVTVSWNGIDLGRFVGGVAIRERVGLQPITDDYHGDEPASFIFTGKSCAVELVGLDTASIADASPYAANLLGIQGGAIGQLASAGAEEIIITERDGSSLWKALRASPMDPTEFELKSTQELRIPLAFVVVPDAEKKLFHVVPSYIYA